MIKEKGFFFIGCCLFLLVSSCHLELLDPIKNGLIADFAFTFEEESLIVPITVTFENLSTEAVSYEWDFGDGSPTSSDFNPIHHYEKPGDHTISLTARNEDGEIDMISYPISIATFTFSYEEVNVREGNTVVNNFYEAADTTYYFFGNTVDAFRSNPPYSYFLTLSPSRGDSVSYTERSSEIKDFGFIPVFEDDSFTSSQVFQEDGKLKIIFQAAADLFGDLFVTEAEDIRKVIYSESQRNAFVLADQGRSGSFNIYKIITLLDRRMPRETSGALTEFFYEDASPRTSGFAMLSSKSETTQEDFENLEIILFDDVGETEGRLLISESVPKADWEIIATANDDFYIYGSSNNQVLTYRISNTGMLSVIPPIGQFFRVKEVLLTEDGNAVILGTTSVNNNFGEKANLLKVDLENNIFWTSEDLGDPFFSNEPESVIQTSDCGFLVVVTVFGGIFYDSPTVYKIDQNGAL